MTITYPKQLTSQVQSLQVPLYHGTSTLFLPSIRKYGLGGANLIGDWKVKDLAKIIWPIAEEQLGGDDEWMLKVQSFGWMAEQKTAAMNFQHGECYVSPSKFTAARYAVSNKFGSELLTYTLDVIDELVRRRSLDVDGLSNQFQEVFRLRHSQFSPILIEIPSRQELHLADENGGDPSRTLALIDEVLAENQEYSKCLFQQLNFRLRSSVDASVLSISEIENDLVSLCGQ